MNFGEEIYREKNIGHYGSSIIPENLNGSFVDDYFPFEFVFLSSRSTTKTCRCGTMRTVMNSRMITPRASSAGIMSPIMDWFLVADYGF